MKSVTSYKVEDLFVIIISIRNEEKKARKERENFIIGFSFPHLQSLERGNSECDPNRE